MEIIRRNELKIRCCVGIGNSTIGVTSWWFIKGTRGRPYWLTEYGWARVPNPREFTNPWDLNAQTWNCLADVLSTWVSTHEVTRRVAEMYLP